LNNSSWYYAEYAYVGSIFSEYTSLASCELHKACEQNFGFLIEQSSGCRLACGDASLLVVFLCKMHLSKCDASILH